MGRGGEGVGERSGVRVETHKTNIITKNPLSMNVLLEAMNVMVQLFAHHNPPISPRRISATAATHRTAFKHEVSACQIIFKGN